MSSITGARVVEHERAGDRQVFQDRGRRRDAVLDGIVFRDAMRDVDLSPFAKVGAALAGFGIERDQPRIECAHEDAVFAAAGLPGAPATDTPAVGKKMVVAIDLGVESPFLFAGFGIDGEYLVER